eukprot:scaffold22614_cov33-Phaeocystis_antarctica.AAC.2
MWNTELHTAPTHHSRHPRQNSSNHRLKAGWKPKSSMSVCRLSLYFVFAKSKETLTSAWVVKRSEIRDLGGGSLEHQRRWLGAQYPGLTLGVPSCPRPPGARRGGAGAELRHRQGPL